LEDIINNSIVYGKSSRFGVVAFVQHLPTKGPACAEMWLSFVACSELFVSYSTSDGGGHPEVVPLSGSLKSTFVIAKH
jgi:hypothetical protein